MNALELALSHIAHGISYSWDLTTLIGFGIPISFQLRQKVLAGSTTQVDAEQLRALMESQARARLALPR